MTTKRPQHRISLLAKVSWISLILCVLGVISSSAQDPVTGAIEGQVKNSETSEPVVGAIVRIINREGGGVLAVKTDSRGYFRRGLLPPGEYTLIFSAPGFKTKQLIVTIWATTMNTVLPHYLEPEVRTPVGGQTFIGTWDAFDLWEAPANWHASSGRLIVNERGVAIPRDKSYRFYVDFSFVSDVKMVNGVAASFAVHALDTLNYYLIQVTGPNADEPHVLRGFIVRNGIPQRWKVIPIEAFKAALQPGKFFEVSMKMTGNSLEVSVTDSETGTESPLGIFPDMNVFPAGTVGIAVRDKEQNEIGRFIVAPIARQRTN